MFRKKTKGTLAALAVTWVFLLQAQDTTNTTGIGSKPSQTIQTTNALPGPKVSFEEYKLNRPQPVGPIPPWIPATSRPVRLPPNPGPFLSVAPNPRELVTNTGYPIIMDPILFSSSNRMKLWLEAKISAINLQLQNTNLPRSLSISLGQQLNYYNQRLAVCDERRKAGGELKIQHTSKK